jgi:hypothetical protein
LFDGDAISFDIDVTEHGVSGALEEPVVGSTPVGLEFRSRQGVAFFSGETRLGRLRIARSALEDPAWFGYFWLRSLILTSLDRVFFEPLHAAGVARDNRGVLLCGDSGAGKTTLAYACAKAGWTLLSEDGVRLAETRDDTQTLVGGRWAFHLREPARELFPELRGLDAKATFNQKLAIVVDPCQGGFSVTRTAEAHSAVFLKRRPGAARITSFPIEAALAYFAKTTQNPDRGLAERRLRTMLGERCVLLEYEDFREAVRELEGLS